MCFVSKLWFADRNLIWCQCPKHGSCSPYLVPRMKVPQNFGGVVEGSEVQFRRRAVSGFDGVLLGSGPSQRVSARCSLRFTVLFPGTVFVSVADLSTMFMLSICEDLQEAICSLLVVPTPCCCHQPWMVSAGLSLCNMVIEGGCL